MSVNFRGSRGWILSVYWPDGLRSRIRMPSQEKGVEMQSRVELAKVDGKWRRLRARMLHQKSSAGLIKDFAQRYFDEYVRRQNRSLRSKRSRLNFIKRRLGKIPVAALRPRHVTSYIAWRQDKGASNATINRDLSVLKHMMEWAVDQGVLRRNRIMRVKKLKETEYAHPRIEAVIDSIFEHMDPRVAPLFTFMRETGCRREEALALKHRQVDLRNGIVVFSGNTKSGKARHVPLTEEAVAAIEAMPYSPRSAYVFYHPDTLDRWHDCRKPWLQAREAAEQTWVRVKDMRTAYGIRLAEDGCPMHFIQEVMGHASVTTTEKHYAKFSPQSAAKMVLAILQGSKQAQKRHTEKRGGVVGSVKADASL